VTDESAATGIHLPPSRAAELVESGNVEVVDVRRAWEWDAGHLAGARHIEVNELTARADEISRDRPVLFVCRGGSRSEMAAEAFRQAGWDAYHVTGGLRAWVEAGLGLAGEIAAPRPD
jgi:rhodanese-related sulfurtransferase